GLRRRPHADRAEVTPPRVGGLPVHLGESLARCAPSPAGAQGWRRDGASVSTTRAQETTRNRSTGAGNVLHLSPAERAAVGKAARAEVPRRSHGEWEPPPKRPDPVELLQEQAASRVPELVPIRYGRMLVSPFTFYRGAAYLMASDLAG